MPEITVVLMARYPEPGQVKSRLASHIGDPGALQVYESLLARAVNAVTSLDANRFSRAVAVTPASCSDLFAEEHLDFDLVVPQVEGDLGRRMHSALDLFINKKSMSACILIGADIPRLSIEVIEEAAIRLAAADLVLGPAVDGGYYLIGMNKMHPELLEGIEWGTSTVLERTLEKARVSGLTVALLHELRDLDNADDLEHFRSFGPEAT